MFLFSLTKTYALRQITTCPLCVRVAIPFSLIFPTNSFFSDGQGPGSDPWWFWGLLLIALSEQWFQLPIAAFDIPRCYDGDLASVVIPEGLVKDRVRRLAKGTLYPVDSPCCSSTTSLWKNNNIVNISSNHPLNFRHPRDDRQRAVVSSLRSQRILQILHRIG